MVALNPPVCDFGRPAIDFDLPGVDGKRHTLESCRGPNGLLVMFICNHCPYVKAIIDRLIRDCRKLSGYGIGSVAIMSNDATVHPEDSAKSMAQWASDLSFPFPYLIDESQTVARAYGAVCTPDFFGYNRQLQLQYRGRLDATGRTPGPVNAERELFEAMKAISRDGCGPARQIASIGCSIKWKTDQACS